MTVEEGDASPLLEARWAWPRRFVAKARDGITDVHGYLYVPSRLDPARRYPVVVYHYPGPQVGTVGTRGFTVSPPGENQALAEFGFVVVTLDALGLPYRSKASGRGSRRPWSFLMGHWPGVLGWPASVGVVLKRGRTPTGAPNSS